MTETNFKHTDLGLIPHDWEVKTLADVGTIRMCKRVMKYQTSESGDIPFYKIGTFGKQADAFISKELYNEFRSKYNYPKKGDILLSAAGTIGRTVVFDGKPAYFQDSNIVWIENNEQLVVNSLLYYIYHRVNWVTDTGTIPRIYNGNVSAISFPLPPTLAEQERIAGALSSIDTLIGALTEQIEKKRHIKQGTMQQLLTGKKRLAGFTGAWKSVRLGELCHLFGRIGFRGYTKNDLVEKGMGAITFSPSDIHDQKIDYSNCDYISFHKYEESPEIKVFNGDIIFGKTASIGKCAIIDKLKEKATINPQFVVLKKFKCNNYFLYYKLIDKPFQTQVLTICGGSTIPTMSQEKLKEQELLFPPTIAEQSAIAAVLSRMDTEIAALEQKRDKYIAIKSGMMQNLLTGKIRLV